MGRVIGDPLDVDPVVDLRRRIAAREATRRVWPYYSLQARPLSALLSGVYVQVTSSGFVDCWQAAAPVLTGPCIDLGFYLYLYAGVQAELRVRLEHPDGMVRSAAATTGVGAGTFVGITGLWLHGRDLWEGPVTVTEEVRRLAGSDPVLVTKPVRYIVRDPAAATAGPTWTVA